MNQTKPTDFELWLETELGEPDQPANRPYENFCIITITLTDGRRYALNIWTFDFLPLARYPWPHEPDENVKQAEYLLPPDLFVENLERSTIERAIAELIETNELKDEWLEAECD